MLNAVFSDIHSNLQAYEAFIKDCEKEKIGKYYCVGDIVGYGANPKECIRLTQGLGCPVAGGNHDRAVADKLSTEYFNEYAKDAVLWTMVNTSEIEKNYLSRFPLVYEEGDITLVHGSLDSPQEFNYIFDIPAAATNLRLQKTTLCFIGHTHVPVCFFKNKNGYVQYTSQTHIDIEQGALYLINVGSIGQPRDGNWRLCYCIYDDENNTLRFRRVEYDVKAASSAIINAGLPLYLASRLERGI